MSDKQGKIIRGFGERLALDNAVRALAEAETTFELERRARELAGKGEPALNAMLRQLDTDNPQLRGGLGLMAQHMEPMLIVPALQRVAASPKRPPQSRLTAVMILERYLDIDIDPDIAQTLPSPDLVARQSAEQALILSEDEPTILVEYAQQLLVEPPEIIADVLRVLTELDDPRRARLLMTIACYGPEDISSRIIPALGGMRHPLALESLRVLRHLSAETHHTALERQARKLQMAGVQLEAESSLRALISPLTAQGQNLLWLIRHPAGADVAHLLILVLHDTLGILHAAAEPTIDLGGLPLPAPVGHVHRLRTPGSKHIIKLLEITPALGRRAANIATDITREAGIPWPPDLVVYGQWLWADETNPRAKPEWPEAPVPASKTNSDLFDALLKHFAFSDWIWDIPDIAQLLKTQGDTPLHPGNSAHQTIAQRLVQGDPQTLLARRLLQQTQWLTLANANEDAALAMAARAAIMAGEAKHPFVWGLAWRSLLTAAADNASRKVLRLKTQAS